MNKRTTLFRLLTLALAVTALIVFSACGNETGKKTGDSGAATLNSEAVQPGTEPDIVVGVGDRNDFLDAEITEPETEDTKATDAPEATESTGTTEPIEATESTQATQPEQTPTQPVTGDVTVTYEEYMAMSGEEQSVFAESFPSVKDFVEWYNSAKEQAEIPEPTVLESDTIVIG